MVRIWRAATFSSAGGPRFAPLTRRASMLVPMSNASRRARSIVLVSPPELHGVDMAIRQEVAAIHALMTAWRREIHAHPETAFEEFRTAERIAGLLQSWGIDVHRGL